MANYAENRKARFDYEIIEKYEAGLELSGIEVKSIRKGKISLAGSFVVVRGGEVFLLNANIEPYQPENTPEHFDSKRHRKLLLTKKEIKELADIEKNKRLTIVPLAVYNKGRKIKISIAIARGKKKHNKKQVMKERDLDREVSREYKYR